MVKTKFLIAFLAAAMVVGGSVACDPSPASQEAAPQAGKVADKKADKAKRSRHAAARLQAKYIKRADAVCAEMLKQFRALPAPTTAEEAADYLRNVNELNTEMLGSVRSLTPPKGDARKLTRIYDEVARAIALSDDELIPALLAQDLEQVRVLEVKIHNIMVSTNSDLSNYGFDECADPA